MNAIQRRSLDERFNKTTHLAGVVFTLATAGILLLTGLQQELAECLRHNVLYLRYAPDVCRQHPLPLWMPGHTKRALRISDHISIYVMIAASYTPICIGVVGGTLGWRVFGILWGIVASGAVYKITAIDRYPRLSLLLYLVMGWSFIFVAEPVCTRLTPAALACIGAEGLFYTGGTWFFAHDNRPFYHGIWHIFVLLGSMAHWTAILLILLAGN